MSPQISSNPSYTLACILGVASPFYLAIAQGAQTAANQHTTLLVDAPTTFDATLQIAIVEKYLAQNVDAMIIAPCDDQALIAPLQKAAENGISVITVDAYIGDGNYVDGSVTFPLAYIGSDNYLGGKLAVQALLEAVEHTGSVFIQSTHPGLSATDLREKGFQEYLASNGSSVTLEGINYDAGSIQTAKEQTALMLERYSQLAGIFATGDYSTQGVLQAVKQSAQKPKIVRFDASKQAIIDLQENTIDAIVAQLPQEMGRIAVEYALANLQNADRVLPKYVGTDLLVIKSQNLSTPDVQKAIYE